MATTEKVTPHEAEIIRHSLGLAYRKRPYRNHFCAAESGEDRETCEALEAKGFMVRGQVRAHVPGLYFFVTEDGAAAVGSHLPKD